MKIWTTSDGLSAPIGPIAVSCGDVAGIGPEIVAKSWLARQAERLPPFYIVGGLAALGTLGSCPVSQISDAREAEACFNDALPVMSIDSDCAALPGDPSERSAILALNSLQTATDDAMNGNASALVTAPVSKAALYRIGFTHGGQTEYVAERSGAATGVMMLAGPSLRVVPVTIHIPLREAPKLLTADLIQDTVRIVANALRQDFGIADPRLVMAGLNPHAGEEGTIGREEVEIIAPALDMLRGEGLSIHGPLPADSLFHAAARSQYDAVLCPTHDQALIPIKALHFDDAVNMTLGLSIIRTSPDHGTAFAIAGKNIANAGSMIAAIRMAGEAAVQRSLGTSA